MTHIRDQTKADFELPTVNSIRPSAEALIDTMVNVYQRKGKDSGRRLLRLSSQWQKRLWPELIERHTRSRRDGSHNVNDLKDRILFIRTVDPTLPGRCATSVRMPISRVFWHRLCALGPVGQFSLSINMAFALSWLRAEALAARLVTFTPRILLDR